MSSDSRHSRDSDMDNRRQAHELSQPFDLADVVNEVF
jgi:hypothetical protein